MPTNYTLTKPDFTPGPRGRHADELAKISASPKGWIYTFDPVQRNISAATWLANVATITLPGHGFLTGDSVTIAGVTAAAYNGTFTVTYVDNDTFTYPLVVADPGAATVLGTVSYAVSRRVEVLTALNHLDSKITGAADAAILPTFGTAVFSTTGTAPGLVTGNVMSVTLTASEPVNVAGTPYIVVAIGTGSKNFVYDALTSTTTSLVFKYTITAADVALAGGLIVPTALTFGTYDGVGDILTATGGVNWLDGVTFIAPDTSTITVN